MPARIIGIVEYGTKYRLRLRHTDDLSPVPFVALSYCWGGDQPVKCLERLIPRFSIAITYDDLPATIQDAIIVCCGVGIKYLWVDALCIIQDDSSDQAVEIAKMPYIYGNATFTIAVARSRSVFEGFLHPRFLAPLTSFILSYECPDGQIGSITLLDVDPTPEPIDERGWTLQERLLSRRTIKFGSRQTRWTCQESKYKAGYSDGWRKSADYNQLRQDSLELNDITNTETNTSQLSATSDEIFRNVITRWQNIVESYTRRELGRATDRALAISGIAEAFRRRLCMSIELAFGLPPSTPSYFGKYGVARLVVDQPHTRVPHGLGPR